MNREQALAFLHQHQPMPSDVDVSQDEYEALLREYNEVLQYFFDKDPCEESIHLFLNSFGNEDGYGIYDVVCCYIYRFNTKQVAEPLLEALKSPYFGVRYWATIISGYFVNSDHRIVTNLLDLLDDSESQVRDYAISTLANYEQIDGYSKIIIDKYQREQSEDVKETYRTDLIPKLLQPKNMKDKT